MRHKTKYSFLVISALCAAAMFAVYCTDPDFDNPLESRYAYALTVVAATGGGVSHSPNRPTCAGGTEVTVTATPDENHTFGGWTAVSGSMPAGVTVSSPTVKFEISHDVNIRANFLPKTYTVTYNGNTNTAGTAPVSQSAAYNTPIVLASAGSLEKIGYTFDGWSIGADGDGALYAAGSQFTVTGNITLYAKWTRIEIETVLVEGGEFLMGCTSDPESICDDDEKPAHRVAVGSFYIMKYEVTQRLWKQVMGGHNPSRFIGDNLPVEQVSWNDIFNDFIPALNKLTGKNYRLPTEAEWEFAARGGNRSMGYKYAGSDVIDDVAWYWSNGGNKTNPVGAKDPNELGIYDMSGNVCEWVSDWYSGYSNNEQIDPTGPLHGQHRVYRGGSWAGKDKEIRVSYRDAGSPDMRTDDLGIISNGSIGFRLVLPLP